MSKKYRSRKGREQFYVRLFYAMLALAAVLIVALIVVPQVLPTGNGGYAITEDGHVHDAAGNHIGSIEEMLADGRLVITEDGHMHDAAGNHVAEITSVTEESAAEQNNEPAASEEPADPNE